MPEAQFTLTPEAALGSLVAEDEGPFGNFLLCFFSCPSSPNGFVGLSVSSLSFWVLRFEAVFPSILASTCCCRTKIVMLCFVDLLM